MGIDMGVIFAYIIGIALIVIIAKFLLIPLKIVVKLLFNAIMGAIAIVIVNFLGGYIGISPIGINFLTALIVGFLGVPGVILILILQYIL